MVRRRIGALTAAPVTTLTPKRFYNQGAHNIPPRRWGKMRSLQEVPASLIEQDGDRLMPPGGGLMIAIGGSLAFWGVLVWLVL